MTAAAALTVHRMRRGALPPWPLTLARLTGIAGPGSPDFDAAMAVVAAAAGASAGNNPQVGPQHDRQTVMLPWPLFVLRSPRHYR